MKLRWIAFCLLVTLLLTGCMPVLPTEPTTAPATTPVTEPATEPTTQPTEPLPVLQAVNPLSFRQTNKAPQFCVVDSRTVATVLSESRGGQWQTDVQILDLYTDEVLAETTLEGNMVPMTGCCDGYLVLFDENTKEATVLDTKLNTALTFAAPSIGGVLLPDLGAYYYIWGSQLRKIDTATGEDTQVEAKPALPTTEIVGYDRDRNMLAVKGAVDVYSSDGCMMAIDLATMECLMLHVTASSGTLAADGVCMTGEGKDEFHEDIVYADWASGGIYSYEDLLRNDKDTNTWQIPGSNYCLQVVYDPESNTKAADMQLFCLGQTLTVCSLMEPMDSARLKELHVLPDGNLLGIAVNRRGYQMYILCPEQLQFNEAAKPDETAKGLVDDHVITLHEQAQADQKLPDTLKEVRAQADAIGQLYGVTVLMSNQCKSAITVSSMDITTTDQAEMENEAEVIAEALKTLDKALKQYPKDFFRQFQDEAGEHGLLILLVENFEGDERGVIGLCYEMYPWYTIAVDITTWEVYNTFCHEIWHATENRINDTTPGLLLPDVWDACNPEEFVYTYNTSISYIEDVEYTFFEETDSNRVFFVDPYAKTNPYEDRARLMEYVMCSKYAEDILESPAMMMKLMIMSDAIRQAFDTEAWESVYWERLLPKN